MASQGSRKFWHREKDKDKHKDDQKDKHDADVQDDDKEPFASDLPARPESADQLWDCAYDHLKASEPKLVELYEQIQSRELGDAESDDTTKSGSNEGTEGIARDHAKRRQQMLQILRKGVKKTEKSANVEENVQFAIGIVLSVKDAVDLGVQSVPQAAVAWGGLCTALQLITNPLTESKTARDGIVDVVSKMKWYSSLTGGLIEDSSGSSEGNVDQLRTHLLENIYELYQVLLKYIVKIVCTLDRHPALNFLRNTIKLDDWAGQISGIAGAELNVTASLDQFGVREANSYLKLLATKKLSEVQDSLMRKLYVADMRAETESLQERKDHLLKASYKSILDQSDFENFTKWDTTSPNLLWIKGDPGKGKTMLFMGIAQELEQQQETHLLAPNLSYFFCQNKDQRLNTATSILRGLIWMLLRQDRALLNHLETFQDHGENPFEDKAAFYNLKRVFKAMIADSRLGRTYLAVDALDECLKVKDEPGRQQLLDLIVETTGAGQKIKWFVSSRNYREIEEVLVDSESGNCLLLDLNDASVAGAVEVYIDFKVAELGARLGKNPPKRRAANFVATLKKLQEDVAALVRQKANGTFLWVAMAFKQVKNSDAGKVLKLIEKMPSDIYDFYGAILQSVQASESAEECRKVLLAVTNSYRPLTLWELAVLAEIPELTDPEDVVHECGLLSMKPDDDVVYFVHQSAQDFLVKQPNDEGWYPILNAIFPQGYLRGHHLLFSQSLVALQDLEKDIYKIEKPGASIEEMIAAKPDPDPLEGLEYSIVNWIEHFCDYDYRDKEEEFADQESVSTFLHDFLLPWLESLALVREFDRGPQLTKRLLRRIRGLNSPDDELQAFLQDAVRLTLDNVQLIEQTPLQLYASTLAFAPEESAVRRKFWESRYPFIESRFGAALDWDPCLQTLQLPGHELEHMVFSQDGSRVAMVILRPAYLDEEDSIQIRDAATGHLQLEILTDRQQASFCLLHFGESCIMRNTLAGIETYDSTTGLLQRKVALDWAAWGYANLSTGALSPDGKTLAVVANETTVCLISTDQGKLLKVISPDGFADGIFSPMLLSSDHLILVTPAFEKPDVVIVRIKTEAIEAKFQTDCSDIPMVFRRGNDIALSLSSDEKRLAILTGSSLCVHSLSKGKAENRFSRAKKKYNQLLGNVVFAPDNPTIILVAGDEVVTWDMTSGKLKARHPLNTDRDLRWTGQSVISPTGNILIYTEGMRVNFWDLGLLPLDMTSDAGLGTELRLSPSGKLATTYSYQDSYVHVWDLVGEKLLSTRRVDDDINTVAISSNDRMLAVYTRKQGFLWDVTSDKTPLVLNGPKTDSPWIGSISPDGSTMVISFDQGRNEGVLLPWHMSSGKLLSIIPLVPGYLREERKSWTFVGSERIVRIHEMTGELHMQGMISGKCLQQSHEFFAAQTHHKLRLDSMGLSSSLDGASIACLNLDRSVAAGTVKSHRISLWDTETLSLKMPETSFSFSGELTTREGELSFSANGQYFNFESHVFPIQFETTLLLTKDWITFNGEKLIHLPARHRQQNYRMNGERFILNARNGSILCLNLDFSRVSGQ